MPNDVKLQEGHPVDENLRPLKVGGKSTAIETAQHGNGARVNGDLEVTGDITGNIKDMVLEDVTVDSLITNSITSPSDLTITPTGGNLFLFSGAVETIDIRPSGGAGGAGASIIFKSILNADDYFEIDSSTNGATILSTVDDDAALAHLTLNIDGDITLNSVTGNFIAEKAGTEFSAENSSYAGMMLGCTHVFGSGTTGKYQLVTTAWESLLWDTDKYALVTFVVPPSNKVKISVFLPYNALASNFLYLGLATDSSATTLNAKYDNKVWDVDETDIISISYSWVVDGSDHSWSAGETKTLYIMAYATAAVRLYTGGTNANYYGGVIVEATALPATIGAGDEP